MIGTVLGNRYEILSEVGSGGMAKVYKAKCRYLQRIVAVKVLKDEFRGDSEFLKRFDAEAQAAASLTHPNIVQIYDVGRDNNRYYIVMEYVDGITLKEYIEERGALDWREAINISIQICSALSKAHSRQIIHRDIKPNNIIMTSDGVPKVADFGIARSVSNQTATMKIETVGSVHYSSPEQVRGGYTDAQSDIYSIGVTIFEMVTGKLPFDGETPVAVALQHIQDPPPVPSSVKPGLPKALDQVILKAMAKSRQDRYATVAELISDLENIRAKPAESDEIVLPNVKHEGKYDTKKFEKLGEEELGKSRTSKTSGSPKQQGNSRKYLMPILYITLIVTILGSIGYFVSTVLNELLGSNEQPKEFIVGNYRGRDIDEVINELELAGIVPEVTYEPSDTVEENVIIKQDPIPDYKMKIGGITKLVLTVSKGQDLVEIPKDLRFKERNQIKFLLEDELDLVVHEVPEYNEEVATNLIIRTDPKDGTKVKRGSTVTVYWSLGPEKKDVVVPELSGLTYDQALNVLLEYNLKVGTTYPEDRQGYQGKIVDQMPKAGETVKEETPIDIYFESEHVKETGDNTSQPTGSQRTFTVQLPQGHNYGETVKFKVTVVDKTTGETMDIIDESNYPVKDFPWSRLVPVIGNNSVVLRVYINDVLIKEETV